MKVLYSTAGGQSEGTRTGTVELDQDRMATFRKSFEVGYVVNPSGGDVIANLSEDDALAATGLPDLRDLVNGAYCVRKVARELDSNNGYWLVTCYFDSRNVDEVPVTEERFWSSETYEKVLERDPVTGYAIVNPVGEKLHVTTQVPVAVLTIERIQESFDEDIILNYVGRCNKEDFFGAPPGCALMADIRDSPTVYDGRNYRKVRYTIKFDLSIDPETEDYIGWDVQLLNEGTKYFLPVAVVTLPDGRVVAQDPVAPLPFLDAMKNPTTGNLRLDGTPCILDPDTGDPLATPDDPTWLRFSRHPRTSFDPLGLV